MPINPSTFFSSKNLFRLTVLLVSGLLNPVMMSCLPIAGGGSSLIFALTIPITTGLFLLMLMYMLLRHRFNWSQKTFDVLLFIVSAVSIFITIATFPYA